MFLYLLTEGALNCSVNASGKPACFGFVDAFLVWFLPMLSSGILSSCASPVHHMNGSSKLRTGIWKQWYCFRFLASSRCASLLDKHCDRNMTDRCILRPIIRAFVACSELLIVPSRTISELSTAQTTGLPQHVCLKSTLRVSSICHRDLSVDRFRLVLTSCSVK